MNWSGEHASVDNESPRSHAWLSEDLATFIGRLGIVAGPRAPGADTDLDLDVLIVGSGYGGAAALAELAGQGIDGQPLRIAMLERGTEHLPGSFASRLSEMPGQVRVDGRPSGLFDLRMGEDANVLVANGLGGGSLINAGVMARPKPAVFQQARWPLALRQSPPTDADFTAMAGRLGARTAPSITGRRAALMRIGGHAFGSVQITVADKHDPSRGVKACVHCGDCFTGCNVGAKLSLDVTLLADAADRHPADKLRFVTGATALRVARPADGRPGWAVHVVPTSAAANKASTQTYELRTRFLILSAGVMGSTEILLNSREAGLCVSPDMLGRHFSANGDSVATLFDLPQRADAVSSEHEPLDARKEGPTITSCIDWRERQGAERMVVQELGVPGPMRRIFEEVVYTQKSIHALTHAASEAEGGGLRTDHAAVDAALTDRSMMVAIIGHDDADGTLALDKGTGKVGVHWPGLKCDARFEARFNAFRDEARRAHPSAYILPNPLHQPLPALLEKVFGGLRGPVTTVHPLGGCAMADDGAHGVVNHLGQVFSGRGAQVHEDLLVLDGAIIPSSLGINPALTIATLASRAMKGVLGQPGGAWSQVRPAEVNGEKKAPRPVYRQPPEAGPRVSTEIEIAELLETSMAVRLLPGAAPVQCRVSLELVFDAQPVQAMVEASALPRKIELNRRLSCLYLYRELDKTGEKVPPSKQDVLLKASLSGHMMWMVLERAADAASMFKTLGTWFVNRGLSDIAKTWQERDAVPEQVCGVKPPGIVEDVWARAKGAWRLASHASQRLLLRYDLTITEVRFFEGDLATASAHWRGHRIALDKPLHYVHAANPIRQLVLADVVAFPNRAAPQARSRVEVNLGYFRTSGFPLIRIVSQQDQAAALLDVASLLLYVIRVLLPIHVWSMRLPDRPSAREPQRLPVALPGVGAFEHIDLVVDHVKQGNELQPVKIRLSRYASPESKARPVLLIHGYSASGTTFAHRLLPESGLAGHLWAKGFDVWVLDLRSSPGMGEQSTRPWLFEHMAYQDIPLAIEHVWQATQHKQMDIVAHCMGGAMLSLALLGNPGPTNALHVFGVKLTSLPERIRRIVFSQVGPAMSLSAGNVARAHIMQWLRYYLHMARFEFTPRKPTAQDDLMDRFFSLVPYVESEYDIENPVWPPGKRTPWVSTRHRMDALYGKTFELKNLSEEVLLNIDDFFGPLNLETVAEVINYGRYKLVTDHLGSVAGNGPEQLLKVFGKIPVMSLHSMLNGLISPGTAELMEEHFKQARGGGLKVEHVARRLQDQGHQDSLIGVKAAEVFNDISKFLSS